MGGLRTKLDLLAAAKSEAATDLLLDTLEEMRADEQFAALRWPRIDGRAVVALGGTEQARLVTLVMASSMGHDDALKLLRLVLRRGKAAGRRAAAGVVHQFGDLAAEELLFELSADKDPLVQADVVGHLRDTGSPRALPRLVQLLDAPHRIVREAVRRCLSEFTFRRFQTSFETLDESLQAATGTLVKRVDGEAIGRLADELEAPDGRRQLRALDMAIAMDAVADVESHVIALGESPRAVVRQAAVKAMGCCNTHRIRTALLARTDDTSAAVQTAARAALDAFVARDHGLLVT